MSVRVHLIASHRIAFKAAYEQIVCPPFSSSYTSLSLLSLLSRYISSFASSSPVLSLSSHHVTSHRLSPLRAVFQPIIGKIMEKYQPGAVVLQCGADSLAGTASLMCTALYALTVSLSSCSHSNSNSNSPASLCFGQLYSTLPPSPSLEL